MSGNSGTYVYLLRAGSYAKIGIADDIGRRIKQLQTACPERIVLESYKWVCCREHALEIEAEFHRENTRRGRRTSGEWFRGETMIEVGFELDYGHRVSLCPDIRVVGEWVRRFIGVPMTWLGSDFDESALSYPFCEDEATLAPPSFEENGALYGYTIGYGVDIFGPKEVDGWYELRDDRALIVGFDGVWSESIRERIHKAKKDGESILRNAIDLDPRYLLTASDSTQARPRS